MHSYSHTIVHLVTLPRVTFLDFIVWFFALHIATMSKVSFQIWKVKIQVLLIFHPLSIWCCYLMASACSLTLIVLSISPMGKLFKVWVTRSEMSAKVSCVICWSNRSRWNSRFLANLLDGDVLLVRQNRNVCLLRCTQSARKNPAWKMKFTDVHDWLLESRKTSKLIFLSSPPLLSVIFH